MRTQAAPRESATQAARPFFGVQAAPAFFPASPFHVAAQAQAEALEEPDAQRVLPPVQAKLAMGAPGDRFEQEADAMADHVVQRAAARVGGAAGAPAVQAKCACCEEEKLQRQPRDEEEGAVQAKGDGALEVPDAIHASLEGGRGGGDSLGAPVRDEMESAFETDFSGVRIHTGSSAEGLNQDLNARAFTYGKDIYFNSGEFRPGSDAGKHLLAHELTHVVQQNPGLQRSPRSERPLASTGAQQVQATLSFGPQNGIPSGTKIHAYVLPEFVRSNADLFIEVKIPGADRKNVETGKKGVADMYKAQPAAGDSTARTIGINFDAGGPSFLKADGKLEGGGATYRHNQESAPQGGELSPRVHHLRRGPGHVDLGDLKPPNLAEAILGGGQLLNYRSGITNTANDLKKWLGDPKNSGENEDKGSWSPTTGNIGSLTIPPDLSYPTGKGYYRAPLAVYENGRSKRVPDAGLVGRMFVYKHGTSGIWVYEWIPETVPASTGSGDLNKVLERLNQDVIRPITQTGGATVQPQRRPDAPAPAVRRRERAVLRRKEEGFPYAQWKGKYDDWKKKAQALLGKPEEQAKGQLTGALVEVDQRTGHKMNLPSEVKERGTGFGRIKHWARFGGIYGWLRNTFNGAYVKVKQLVDKVKKKVKGLAKKVGATSFGNWVKAAAKVIFKIFKIVASWAITQVIDRLVGSLHEGINNNIRKLVDAVTPEGVKSRIEEFEEKKAEYEDLLKAKEEEIEKKLFGDKLDLFEKLQEWEEIANQASTVITLVEWGVRLIACASPPAIGCLWNLVISALQAAFALLIQTCWFTKKVYAPILSAIKPVRDFPATIAKYVVDKANELIPWPKGLDPLFAPIVLDENEIKVDCGDGDGGGGGASLTPERQAILELAQEIGSEKFCAMLDLMVKRGAGPWVLLTPERVTELKAALAQVKTEDLKAAAAAPQSEAPAALQDVLADIAKYTKQEKALIKQEGDRKAAAAGSKSGGGGEGGVEFKRPIVSSPGATTGKVTTNFAALTTLPEALKPGVVPAAAIDLYLVIGVQDEGKVQIANVYPVSVKVKSVSDTLHVFVNQQTFYAYYNKEKFVEILKDYEIRVPNDRIKNLPP